MSIRTHSMRKIRLYCNTFSRIIVYIYIYVGYTIYTVYTGYTKCIEDMISRHDNIIEWYDIISRYYLMISYQDIMVWFLIMISYHDIGCGRGNREIYNCQRAVNSDICDFLNCLRKLCKQYTTNTARQSRWKNCAWNFILIWNR